MDTANPARPPGPHHAHHPETPTTRSTPAREDQLNALLADSGLTVRGMMPYGQSVEFVDLIKKCPKSSWVAFSKSHVAFFQTGFGQQNPAPFWHSGPEVTLELVPGGEEGVVRFYWPENGMAVLKLSEEEDLVVKNYAQLHGAGWSRFV